MDIKENKTPHVHVKPARHKLRIGTYALLAVACLVGYFLVRLDVFSLLGNYRTNVEKILLASAIGLVVMGVSALVEMLVVKKSATKSLRYNLVRFIRLVAVLVVIMVFVSFLFHNWYTAAVSLGLISLILGFALQTPITSFIGWLYIIFRAPYHVGDRIQIDTFTGDVVEISYLDTTLWEFAGNYLTNDMPSGRLIRFPNSLVLQSPVYNYSWKSFPYIWNELPFHVAYTSDLNFVETTIREVAKSELGDDMAQHIEELKEIVKQTPVDELEIKEYPYISFRTNANTWIEVTVTYLVAPKQATAVRTRILRKALEALNKEPDKVLFPKGDSR